MTGDRLVNTTLGTYGIGMGGSPLVQPAGFFSLLADHPDQRVVSLRLGVEPLNRIELLFPVYKTGALPLS